MLPDLNGGSRKFQRRLHVSSEWQLEAAWEKGHVWGSPSWLECRISTRKQTKEALAHNDARYIGERTSEAGEKKQPGICLPQASFRVIRCTRSCAHHIRSADWEGNSVSSTHALPLLPNSAMTTKTGVQQKGVWTHCSFMSYVCRHLILIFRIFSSK